MTANPDIPRELAESDLCCKKLFDVLSEGKLALAYDDEIRELQIFDKGYNWVQRIDYCPFCGAVRPPSLADEWERTLLKKYGPNIFDEPRKIPKDFLCSAWWRKRGL